MDPPPLSDHPQELSVKEALCRKRNSLDLEIEQFKALKESEFRAYEEELRRQTEGRLSSNVPVKDSGTGPTVERGFKPNGTGRPSATNQTTASFGIQQPSPRHTVLSQQLAAASQGPSKDSIPKFDEKHQGKKEREMELRSLFPTFLPLLESTRSNSTPSPSLHSHRRSLSAQSNLSSSLTTLPSTTYGGHSPVQSSSAPRPSLGDRRSSSSPTAGSLRSSLRQPKSPEQGPREAKHVLFSIDNVVMSPSSSPVLQRGRPGKKSKKSTAMANAQKGPNVDKSKTTEAQEAASIPPIDKSKPKPPTTSTTPHPRSYQELIEPTVTTSAESSSVDEFGAGSDDPLFDLEDDAKGAPPIEDDDGDFHQADRERMKDQAGEANLAVNPHAGSLPIEIKWPGRRG